VQCNSDYKQLSDIVNELVRVKERLKEAEEALKYYTDLDISFRMRGGMVGYSQKILVDEILKNKAEEYFEKWKSE
jgi:hypothetical protein